MNETNESTTTNFGLMKYVHAMFVAGLIIGAWLFIQVVETAWITANLTWADVPAPNHWMILLIGAGSAIGLTFYLWRHPKVNRLSIEIVTELSKVIWPAKKELWASTVVVLIVSVIASIILFAFDAFWSWATTALLSM